ncbi:hypothetical protein EC912_106102 [Luteibacter rhizovicinus]|uniref:Uncharacterized protein n=1 Tax=Luteibacter rhizovicinus TaxID=242606 RepID=A0A4R3YNN3_9GAMM|nr:hypothetical protein [Luteibacter rhizovicinus]TCV92764.1 hypothetical protein EC912_106102 [Luteibacter rhizovicinus]
MQRSQQKRDYGSSDPAMLRSLASKGMPMPAMTRPAPPSMQRSAKSVKHKTSHPSP